MGEPENPHFYDLGTFGSVPERQNQLYLSLETPGQLKQIKNIPGIISKPIFLQISKMKLGNSENVRNDARRQIPPSRLIKSRNSWI